jgi:hypothetical protein
MGWVDENVPKEVADYLFNIKLNLPERVGVFQRDVRKDLETDFDMLEEQLAETPAMMNFYDQLVAEQKAVVATLERKAEVMKGKIVERIVTDANDRGVKIRREDVKDIIESDDEYIMVKAKIILETLVEDKIRAVARNLGAKNDNLRSLAGFKREEKRQA